MRCFFQSRLSVALKSAWCVCAVSSTSLIYAQDFCFVSFPALSVLHSLFGLFVLCAFMFYKSSCFCLVSFSAA